MLISSHLIIRSDVRFGFGAEKLCEKAKSLLAAKQHFAVYLKKRLKALTSRPGSCGARIVRLPSNTSEKPP